LLPKYGGKGMYGHHVHAAVIAAGEAESGITIHRVNEHYDEGTIPVPGHLPGATG
jgi:phosphoribosylglycinamide formyltransferase-1